MSESITRREFSQKTLQSLLTFAFLDTLYVQNLFANEIKPITTKWIADLDELSRDVKDEKVKQLEWQKKVEDLLAQVDMKDLLHLVDFEALKKRAKFREKGETSLRFKFKEIDGIPTKLVIGKQIFALNKGRSVAPHGHDNMATAFLILQGKLHGRHFDRVRDEPKHFIVRPTIDGKFGPGQFSTISDYKDNIHWFTAETDRSFIFNFHVLGLKNDKKARTGRVYLDPNGEKVEGGLIRARRISYKEAYELYG